MIAHNTGMAELLPEKFIHLSGAGLIHGGRFRQLLHAGFLDGLKGLESTHQGFSSRRTDPLDVIQDRMHLLLAAQGAVILDGKPVCLILDPGDQPEALRGLS